MKIYEEEPSKADFLFQDTDRIVTQTRITSNCFRYSFFLFNHLATWFKQ